MRCLESGYAALHLRAQAELAQLWFFVVRERLGRRRVLLHDRPRRKRDGARGRVACARKIGLLEVVEPRDDFVGWCGGEKEANLAFYLLLRTFSTQEC